MSKEMNQPKFKFGDKVVSDCTGKPFTIDKIEFNGEEFIYFGKDYVHQNGCGEFILSPFKEPQKKKLYAWSSLDGVVFHVKNENVGREVFHRIGIDAQNFKRDPDYDIEYSEPK